jgi:hypothetical protein
MKKLFLILAVLCLFGCLEETKQDDVSYIYFLQEDFAGKIICIVDGQEWSRATFNEDGSLTAQSYLWPGDTWHIVDGKLIINETTYLMLEDDTEHDFWTVQRHPDGKIVYMFYNQTYNALQADAYVNGAELAIDTRVEH